MSEQLGKIEKPSTADFTAGRKIYFVPLVYSGYGASEDYGKLYNKYWEQVEKQLSDLELKLGTINRIFHEFIPATGEEGLKAIKELNEQSYQVIKKRLDAGAQLEAMEESELLSEFMDWAKCIMAGLQNEKVMTKVHESYIEASKKRNEFISRRIAETIQADEIGVLFIREGYQIPLPPDIQMINVVPPALDEINRLLRDSRNRLT